MNPTFFRQPSRSLVARLVAGTLVPALSLVSVPVSAAPGTQAAQQAAPAVKVNRTVPKVRPVPLRPVLSAEPSDQELLKARIFEEPFVPVGGPTTPDDNRRLGQAIQAFGSAGDRLDLGPFERFLWNNDTSPWRASVLVGMGAAYLRAGRFTRAARSWQEAWNLSRSEEDQRSRAVADRALGELANLRARFGQITEAELLLKEAEGRRMRGSAIEKLNAAGAQLAARTEHPDLLHPTGAVSLASILANRARGAYKPDPRLEYFRAPQYGSTLSQIEELARDVGLNLRMAYHADKDAPVEVPSVAHLSMGHYAAVVARNDAGTRYLLEDAAYGLPLWITREALLEEVSGYFLIEGEELPEGWRRVGKADGDRILGRCLRSGHSNNTTPQDEKEGDCDCSGKGLATYRFHALTVSLNITDTPVGYSPPRGPAVSFEVTYNHKEAGQPSIFSYSNLGSRWTFDQLSFIEDDHPEALVLHVRGGGLEAYTDFDGQSTGHHYQSQNQLVRVSNDPIVWEVRHSDGSVDTYSQPDCEICSGRRVFLTRSEDSVGNAVTCTYDEDLRLVAIADAIGQVTTVSHELPADPLKITRVTDPFGRSAQFEYDGVGNLVRITDVLGLSSQFRYDSTEPLRADFITALTTPYGTTIFRQMETSYGYNSILEATDPLGGTERIAYDANDNLVPVEQRHPAQDDPATVPFGFAEYNVALNRGLTHYWSKRAMALYPGDYRKAKVIRWFTEYVAGAYYTSGVKQSEKLPLENRVWYGYQGVTPVSSQDGSLQRGPSGLPTKVGRVLEDGTSQIQAYEYNSKGHRIRSTDSLGRTTIYVYAPDEVDLLEVRLANGQSLDHLASYTYNDQHRPLTATDASGQTTSYTYTAGGQIATIVTPVRDGLSAAERTTTYEYYPSSDPAAPDRLKKVTGPGTAQGAATTTYTYDAFGRLRTTTDSDGYTVTQDYDALDRPTRTTYPDGTYEETSYDRLDAVGRRDRLGRLSHTFYDLLRRVVGTKDPAGRTTRQEYGGGGCLSCGGGNELTGLVDANGNVTRWEYDDQGRRTKEIRANGAEYHYAYDAATGRLKTTTDPKGNVKTNVYNRDGTLAAITYSVAEGTSPTPNVSFTYEPIHNRVTSMTDGTGTTTYAYYPVTSPPTLGAGKLQSVDGPLANDTIEYGYDELGRIRTRQIGTSANTQTQLFDSEGRLTTLTNALGSFTYAYDGVSGRPTTLTYPNGQTTTWAYHDNLGDHRLQEIHNKRPGGATLSRFTYTYDEAGNILTWKQQADSDPANVYYLGYDKADQLTAAILKTTDPTPVILKRYYYAYDSAGNRTAEQIDDAVTGATYNNMNQLVSQQAGGALIFKGTVSEPASVTIAGKPVAVTADNRFEGQAVVPGGTGQVAVTATDPSGNVRTSTYQVSQGTTSKAFTYDLNGNMTSDGTRAYEWDAENRLVAVKEGGTTVGSYSYNKDGMRTSRTAGGVGTSYVLDGPSVVEERLTTGGITKHFRGPGIDNVLAIQDGAAMVTYLTRDHLGSVRELVNAAGTVVQRRSYDPWGNLTISGGNANGWAFTGRENDSETGLYYYRARYYEAGQGRFVSVDPISFQHSYQYAAGNPIGLVDPTGLTEWSCDVRISAAELIVGWTGLWAECEACYKDGTRKKKVKITGGGAGLGGPIKLSTTKTHTTMDDHRSGEPSEKVFEGIWKMMGSFSGAVGPKGGAATWFFQIGRAISSEWDTADVQGNLNLDFSATIIAGGKVTNVFAWDE